MNHPEEWEPCATCGAWLLFGALCSDCDGPLDDVCSFHRNGGCGPCNYCEDGNDREDDDTA